MSKRIGQRFYVCYGCQRALLPCNPDDPNDPRCPFCGHRMVTVRVIQDGAETDADCRDVCEELVALADSFANTSCQSIGYKTFLPLADRARATIRPLQEGDPEIPGA